jgi:hypothetical protein
VHENSPAAKAGSGSIVSMVTYVRERTIINDISKLKVFLLKTNKKSFLNKSITKEKAFKTLIFPTFTTDLILN